MNVLLIYFLKVVAIQAILYLIYTLIFHKSGRHAINRFYLILALVGSFLIPFLPLPNLQSNQKVVEMDRPIWYELAEFNGFSNTETEFIPVERLNQSDYTMEFVILVVLLISSLLLIKLIHSHFQLIRLKGRSDEISINGHKIYCSEIESPFSYFRSIFIPKGLLNSTSFDTIIEHELVHVKKLHSVDRIFIEIVMSLLWFNPLLYLFRNRLIETHEFQADAEVISLQQDAIAYQEILFQQVNTQNAISSANYFKLNTIKTRIKMMNKNKKLSRWHYLLMLPVLALMTFSFANKENAEFIAPVKSDVSDVFDYVINPSDNYTPSIFPLQYPDGVRLTASHGMRVHPILKVERMHEGIDLSTRKGNPVLATADGVVKEAGIINEVSRGKIVRIKHGDIYETVYAHLSDIAVKKGDKIKRGDIIGKAGATGNSTVPHLHYEVKGTNKGFLDPVDFINDYDFESRYLMDTEDSNTPSIMPVLENELVRLTSGFGKRQHPILKVEKMHEGVDFALPVGKKVVATARGTINKVVRSDSGFGNYVSVDHSGLYQTFYAQLSEINVRSGQKVERGDVIALSGNSGTSTGPHLHYEVRNAHGKALDPLDFINSYSFKPKVSEKSAKMKLHKENEKLKVVIDPGHGGKDNGVSSKGLTEKEIALKVAKEVAEIFKDSDQVEIILTRDQDEMVSLKDRVNKSENADLFVSLHIDNHANEGEDQTLAIYNESNNQSEEAAYFGKILNDEFSKLRREFKLGYTVGNTNGYYILQNSKAPAILFVMGYFSNPVSEKYLNSEEGMKEIAEKLSVAIGAAL